MILPKCFNAAHLLPQMFNLVFLWKGEPTSGLDIVFLSWNQTNNSFDSYVQQVEPNYKSKLIKKTDSRERKLKF